LSGLALIVFCLGCQKPDAEKVSILLNFSIRPSISYAMIVEIPAGLGQVVFRDGRTVPAYHALVILKGLTKHYSS
jgi:hypothetical protein